MKSLYHYFKPSSGDSPLPSPSGPLSKEVPAVAINKALKDIEDKEDVKRRGTYQKYTPKDKAMIGNYAIMHGTSAALRYFKNKFPDLKYTTVCEWRKAIVAKTRKNHEVLTELEEKREEGQQCSLKMSFPLLQNIFVQYAVLLA